MSTACTQKNDVGPLDHAAPAHARSSLVTARANRGHTTTLKIPASTKNQSARLPITPPSDHIAIAPDQQESR